MQRKKFIMVFFILIFMFCEVSKADGIPIASTFKQGIYEVSDDHEGLYRNIKLITPDKPITILILDANGAQIMFAQITNTNEYLKTGPIKKGETLIIKGEGEISLVH